MATEEKVGVEEQRITVTLRKSAIGYAKRQKATLKALGLTKLGQSVVHTATPQIRGMVRRVSHLVIVEDV